METREFLTRTWNMERMERPALIVEENVPRGPRPRRGPDDSDPHGAALQDGIWNYDSLLFGRDDNIPALSTGLGTHIVPMVFGARERVFEDGHKYLEGPVIFSAADVDRLKIPVAMTSLLKDQVERIRTFADQTDGRYPIRIGDIQNPLSVASVLWETNDFFLSLIEDGERVHRLLGMIADVIAEYIDRMKEACKGIVPLSWPALWVPEDYGVYMSDDAMSMVSPDMYEEYSVPYNDRITGRHGGYMLHSCVLKKPYFEGVLKNRTLKSVNFAAQYSSDMEEIYGFFGGRKVLLPHYVHTDSPQIGTPAEFIEKVAKCWSPETPTLIYVAMKPGGGLQEDVHEAYRRCFAPSFDTHPVATYNSTQDDKTLS